MNQLISAQNRKSILYWFVFSLAFFALTIAITLVANHGEKIRVGDGSEYYAMELAWSQTHRPYMTDKAWVAYAQEFAHGGISHMVPPSQLRDSTPALRLGTTSDFNHFWMYSALAAAIGILIKIAGISLDSHQSFLLLHAALCALLIVLSSHWHGRRGFFTALFLTFCSPMLWYITKVHTEFFTFCLTTMAVAAVMQKRWALAAFFLAVTTTQNISFAIPAAYCGVCALITLVQKQRTGMEAVFDAIFLCITTVVTLLHPLYYFSRYAGFTPQLIDGSATLKYADPFIPLNFLFDPDLGLFPNWALGTVAAIFCAFVLVWQRCSPRLHLLGYIAVYTFAALIAQGATTTINSGASIYISRYALWYICLFYPIFVATLYAIGNTSPRTRILTYSGLATFFLVVTVVNGREYAPNRDETYLTPSPTASFIYRFIPWLYDPNTDIFSGRNAGLGAGVPPRPSIILGPGCRKALILTGIGATPPVLGHALCGLSQSAVRRLAQAAGGWSEKNQPYRYFTITGTQFNASLTTVVRGSDLSLGARSASSNTFLVSGWSQPESWGVWSDGHSAKLRIKIDSNFSNPATVSLTMKGFFFGRHRHMTITPIINGTRMQAFVLDADMAMPVTQGWVLKAGALRNHGGIVDIELVINQPRSPAELGLSADHRKLGIGLTHIRVE